jgi:hypothetical protein
MPLYSHIAAAVKRRNTAQTSFYMSNSIRPNRSIPRGYLIQSKRTGPGEKMSTDALKKLKSQCDKMLGYSSDSFVFAYDPAGMRCGSANRIVCATGRNVYNRYCWTAYRFFLEFYRCSTGDGKITSARVKDLQPRHALRITAEGDFQILRRQVRLDSGQRGD